MGNKRELDYNRLKDEYAWKKFIQAQRKKITGEENAWKNFHAKMKERAPAPKKTMRDDLWTAFMQTFGLAVIHKPRRALETLNEEEQRDMYAEDHIIIPSDSETKKHKNNGLTKIKIAFVTAIPSGYIIDLEPLASGIPIDKAEALEPMSAWVRNRTDESLSLIVSSKKQHIPSEAVSPIKGLIPEGIYLSFYWKNAPTKYPFYEANLTFLTRRK
ncbi:MAG: hypothetical protein Q8P29_01835 [Candidatus Levybacteria bacterium]|nr:hypothetical protein [Candidatus Levybacteria bacterium]